MSKRADLENLVRVKTALAEKYERLARTVGSQPKRTNMLHHAARFRQQVANVQRLVEQQS